MNDQYELRSEPGAPADIVDHQHDDQHLGQNTEQLQLGKKILLTLMILRRPLLIVLAAEQAWLL